MTGIEIFVVKIKSHKENFPLLNNNMGTAEETKLSLALFAA